MATVNGDVGHSAFLEHLLSYPVVSDGVSTVKQNKLGQQGIALSSSLSNTAYETLKPVIPYLAKPYGYVSPYVKKADSVADRTLSHLDARFPVVTKPTAEVYADTKNMVTFPYRKGVEGRDHILTVYSDERKSLGPGLFPLGQAVLLTALCLTTETLTWMQGLVKSATAPREKKD